MIKCNATGRHCICMKDALANPLQVFKWKNVDQGTGIIEDKEVGVIVYRMRLAWEDKSTKPPKKAHTWVEYVMPYCPWCGARLRLSPAQREEKRAKAKT